MKRLWIYQMFLFTSLFVAIAVYPQETQISKSQVAGWLNRYLDENEGIATQEFYYRSRLLEKKGIDPVAFAEGMLKDIEFSDFWDDAVWLYAAKKVDEAPETLIDPLVAFMERKEKYYPLEIIRAKSECLNIIKQLIGPNFLKNEALKQKIFTFADRFFTESDPIDINQWYHYFGVSDLAAQPIQSLNPDQQMLIAWVQSHASMGVKFAGYLYYATGDEKYEKILQAAKKSECPSVSRTAIFLETDSCLESWKSGEYEIFAMNRNRPKTPNPPANGDYIPGNTRDRTKVKNNKN
ncbi:MAG: hypothetical protein AB1656_03470 [Candidatus Omnitrophota bacterium]